jgi:hypothetical protein
MAPDCAGVHPRPRSRPLFVPSPDAIVRTSVVVPHGRCRWSCGRPGCSFLPIRGWVLGASGASRSRTPHGHPWLAETLVGVAVKPERPVTVALRRRSDYIARTAISWLCCEAGDRSPAALRRSGIGPRAPWRGHSAGARRRYMHVSAMTAVSEDAKATVTVGTLPAGGIRNHRSDRHPGRHDRGGRTLVNSPQRPIR